MAQPLVAKAPASNKTPWQNKAMAVASTVGTGFSIANGIREALPMIGGVARAACGAAGIPTAEYAPAAVKAAVVGYGRASKQQVQQMVQRLLGLEKVPATDEADALAVGICHGHSRPRSASRAGAARDSAVRPQEIR